MSVFNEDLIKSKFLIIDRNDPCYILKSKKNPVEIKNMMQSHISDGVALTKFIIWIKNLKNIKLTEMEAEKKLEYFRKKIIIIYIQVLIQLQERDQMVQSFIIALQKKQIKLSKKRSISL